jgi:hypothetical protein
LNEAAAARLHAATKSLHVLSTSRAEFAAAAFTSRIVGLRNSRKHKKHRYAERQTNDSVCHHLVVPPAFLQIMVSD